MKMLVMKFGGTSLSDEICMARVAAQIRRKQEEGWQVVVVASAPGKTTNELLDRAWSIGNVTNRRELDMLLSVGEQIAIALLVLALENEGAKAVSLTGLQAGIITNGDYGRARILRVQTERILGELAQDRIVVVAGYQGCGADGEITTLGRGGSDTTAVALAAALDAPCEIWTDVDGIFSAHPALVPDARLLPELSYEEMLAMADAGAQVLKASAADMAKRMGVDLAIGSSYSGNLGSRVTSKHLDGDRVTAVTLEEGIALVSLTHTNRVDNFRLIAELARQGVAVLSIWERDATCGLFIAEADLEPACALMDTHYEADVHRTIDHQLALVSVVGSGINFTSDVVAKVLAVFEDMSLIPEHYFFTEMRVSFAVSRIHAPAAIARIHKILLPQRPQLATV